LNIGHWLFDIHYSIFFFPLRLCENFLFFLCVLCEKFFLRIYPVRIGLETTWINVLDGGGRYTNEVVRNLCTLFPEHRFFAIGPEPRQRHDYPNLTHVPFPDTVGLAARFAFTVRTAPVLKILSLDLYHILVNFGIYDAPCPVVATVHDLLTLKYPELRARRIHGWLYRYYVPFLVKRADVIVADSRSTKEDLRKLYGIRGRVETVPLGYNKALFSTEEHDDRVVMDRYRLEPGYLLFVGNLIPKKNVEIIIRALGHVRKRGLRSCDSLRLVLAGRRGHGSDRLFRCVDELGLHDSVVELGYVPDDDLGALYRQALLFLFPSKYEGFGLPVIEAMACGTPVLVSNTGPLPELVDDCRFQCSPESAEDWAEKIVRFAEDAAFYAETKRWCHERAQFFSWERCVEDYMRIYRSLIR